MRAVPRDLSRAGPAGRTVPARGARRPLHRVSGVRRGLPPRRDPRSERGTCVTVSINPIEAESYRILASRVDLSRFGPLGRAVGARVIHASADLEYASTMGVDEAALA